MRTLMLLLALAGLSACNSQDIARAKAPVLGIDQCLRAQLFKECLTTVPKGPERIANSNDWEEVVGACEDSARRMAARTMSIIKPECAVLW